MKSLLVLPLALALAGQDAAMDMDAIRSRALRFTALAPSARAQVLGQELDYAGLHPEPLPGGHFIIRFPGPHLGEDPDVIAVPLDWSKEDASGGRAAAALVELARTLKIRHFRPKHVLWLLWANQGAAGMEALIQSQEHQNKQLAHVLLLEGGWEGLATASEGRLTMDLGFEGRAPSPESFRALLGLPAGVGAQVDKGAANPAGGLTVELRSPDGAVFRGLEALVRAAGIKAGAKAMGPLEIIPPAQLAGGAAHPLAQMAAEQVKRTMGAAPETAVPRGGPLAVLLAHQVPSLALGLGVFEGSRPMDLMRGLAEEFQNLP